MELALDRSGHAHVAGHAGLLVLDDMAMQQPVAGIVGNEGKLHLFIRLNEIGIGYEGLYLLRR